MLVPVLTSLVALAAAPGPVSIAPASASAQQARPAEVEAVLASPEPFQQRVAELVELGPGVVPELFDGICARAEQHPPSTELELLRTALARLDRAVVTKALEAAAQEPEALRRIGAIVASPALGGREGLALAVNAASYAPPGSYPEPRVVDALARAAQEQLRTAKKNFEDLPWLAREAPSEVTGALVRAAAEVGGESALEALVRMLGRNEAVDATVLCHLGRAARDVSPPLAPKLSSPILSALNSMDDNVVRCALQAVGQLELVAAVEPCIELLDSSAPQLAIESHRALTGITRLQLPASSARWLRWFQQERAWFDHEAALCFATLSSGAPADRRRAVDELLKHRLDRHRLALELSALLECGYPDLRRLAVEALRRLESRAAVPALVLSLSDPDPEVARLAHETLRALTGKDHAPDSAAWLEVLDPD